MDSFPDIEVMPPEKQARLDQLLDESSEGIILPNAKLELEELVSEAEQMMVQNAHRPAEFAKKESPSVPSSAMPVTVWVKPQSTSPRLDGSWEEIQNVRGSRVNHKVTNSTTPLPPPLLPCSLAPLLPCSLAPLLTTVN